MDTFYPYHHLALVLALCWRIDRIASQRGNAISAEALQMRTSLDMGIRDQSQ